MVSPPGEQKRILATEAVPGKVPAEATPVPHPVFSAPYDQPSDPWGLASLTEAEKLDAIQCLLGEENDLRAGGFGGATRPNVSQLFGPTQANLNALYFISYIYGGNFNHASANALEGNGANIGHWQYVTSDAAIHRAYQAYRIWFSKVRQMGLANAWRADLQPLDGTGLSWYGGHARRPAPCRSDTACAR
jgi:hypothetical protein